MPTVDSKREEFRKYLEKAGVMDALTKVLVALYEEPEKPANAIEYIRDFLAKLDPQALCNEVKKELDVLRIRVENLEELNAKLREKLQLHEKTEPGLAVEGDEIEAIIESSLPASDTSQAQPIEDTIEVQPVTETEEVQPVTETVEVQPGAYTVQANPVTGASLPQQPLPDPSTVDSEAVKKASDPGADSVPEVPPSSSSPNEVVSPPAEVETGETPPSTSEPPLFNIDDVSTEIGMSGYNFNAPHYFKGKSMAMEFPQRLSSKVAFSPTTPFNRSSAHQVQSTRYPGASSFYQVPQPQHQAYPGPVSDKLSQNQGWQPLSKSRR